MNIFRASVITLLVAMAAMTASAQDKPIMRDDVLAADAARIIGNHVLYSVFDYVEVQVKDGNLLLTGSVTDDHKRRTFERVVMSEMPEFKGVVNNIELQPASSFDQGVRRALARAIYGDPRMLRYALARWPYPIHIIVENGHVTLLGTVNSEADKQLINIKARSVFGVISLENNLRIS